MHKYLPLAFILFLCACTSSPLDMTEEEIDAYVASCTDESQVYDIRESLRFSQDDEAYEVTEYSRNDSVILYSTEESTVASQSFINMYFKDDFPIYQEEYTWEMDQASGEYLITERKIYFTGDDVLIAYQRSSDSEEELESEKFEEFDVEFATFDFIMPEQAISQSGDFEMKFGEFLVINPDSYLILDNDDSGWGVALYIIEGDMLLDELFANPEEFQGKTIEVRHEFMVMNGIERMIYRGGILKEK